MYGTVAVALRRTRVLLRLLQLYLQQDLRKIRNKSASMIGIVKRVRGWVGVGGCGCVDEEGRAHDDMHILVCVSWIERQTSTRGGVGGGVRGERGGGRQIPSRSLVSCVCLSACVFVACAVRVRACVRVDR